MFCPEDGTEIPMSLDSPPNAWYHPCPECGTAWHYDGEGGVYRVEGVKPIELIPTLQAIGLTVTTECPVHPGSDHGPFDCPPEKGAIQ